jgi:hypothetical protein
VLQARRLINGSRAFLILGTALFTLTVLSFPMRTILADHGEPLGFESFPVGWLFAPIMAAWGLASLVFGLLQARSQKAEKYLQVVFAFALFATAFGVSFGGLMVFFFGSFVTQLVTAPFWWLYLALFLVPSVTVLASCATYYRKEEKIYSIFAKWKIRVALFAATLSVPVSYFTAMVLYLNLL